MFGISPRDLHVRNVTTGFTCSEYHHRVFIFSEFQTGRTFLGIHRGHAACKSEYVLLDRSNSHLTYDMLVTYVHTSDK